MSEIGPVKLIEEYYRERHPFAQMHGNFRKPVDSKVQCLVLSQIGASPSTLLASATSPKVVINLIPGIALPTYSYIGKETRRERRAQRAGKKAQEKSLIPIGLPRCELYPPLNAIVQLMIFLPAFRNIFSFAPHSYQLLSDCVDQYLSDQEKKNLTSSADIAGLLRLLIQKMPAHFFRFQAARIEIRDFLCSLIKTVFGQFPSPISDSLAFHPEWSVVWDTMIPFSCIVDLPSRPRELFISMRGNNDSACPLIKRQFFTQPDGSCYDLDAFIEYRPDGRENEGDHIAYLKSEGGWYQCDDDRITPMRSTNLNMALNRGILLHYKRIWPK